MGTFTSKLEIKISVKSPYTTRLTLNLKVEINSILLSIGIYTL